MERVKKIVADGVHDVKKIYMTVDKAVTQKAIREYIKSLDAAKVTEASGGGRRQQGIYSGSPRSKLSIDLWDLSRNPLPMRSRAIKYILVVVDVFSKKLSLEFLKDKSSASVLPALKRHVTRECVVVYGDGESAWRHADQYWSGLGCDYVRVEHASHAESAIRILKQMATRVAVTKGERADRFVKQLAHRYNQTWNQTVNMTPLEAERPKNVHRALEETTVGLGRKKHDPVDALVVGAKVRVKESTFMRKGTAVKWSVKLYTVERTTPNYAWLDDGRKVARDRIKLD